MAAKPEKTSRSVKHIAGKALKAPSKVTRKQVQKLAGSVESHIQPRRKTKKR